MTLDVRARLAQGAAAVADWPQQNRDWYYAEDGLRLDVLDADAAALTAASAGAEEALHIHREALDLLSHAWLGGSGAGAGEFLARQSAAAAEVIGSLRSAAVVLSALRADLEQLVDAKVDSACSGEWSVIPGSGTDGAVPYDVAISRLGDLPAPHCEIPARSAEFAQRHPPAAPPAPQPVPDQAPAAVSAPVSPPVSAPLVPSPGQGWTSGAPVGALPGIPGIPDIGGSLAGLVTWIAQTLGSYADTPTPPKSADVGDATTPDGPVDKIKPDVAEQHSSHQTPLAAEAPPVAVAPAPAAPGAAPAEPGPAGPVTPVGPVTPAGPVGAAPVMSTPEPAVPPPPLLPPAPAAGTPCEIAADELPQVGR